jgi:uncharacterized protein
MSTSTIMPPTMTHDFVSATTGRAYRLMITPPAGSPPSDGWPMFWVLDGSGYHGMAVDLIRNIGNIGGEIEPALVVAVTYPTDDFAVCLSRRQIDLTPTAVTSDEMVIAVGQDSPSGDLDGFLDMIVGEALPFVSEAFSIDAARMALVGHSLGGLAAIHTLFTRPALFQTLIALCPSIWWDNRVVLSHEAAFVAGLAAAKSAPRLFLAVGGLEQTMPKVILPEGVNVGGWDKMADTLVKARMIDNCAELAARLSSLVATTGFEIQYHCPEGETHLTTPPVVYPKALAMAFPRTLPTPS